MEDGSWVQTLLPPSIQFFQPLADEEDALLTPLRDDLRVVFRCWKRVQSLRFLL